MHFHPSTVNCFSVCNAWWIRDARSLQEFHRNCRQIVSLFVSHLSSLFRWFMTLSGESFQAAKAFWLHSHFARKGFRIPSSTRLSRELAFQSLDSTFPFLWLTRIHPNGVDRFFPPRWAIIHLSFQIFLLARSGLLYFSMKNDWINAEKQPPRRVENPKHRFRSCELAPSSWFTGGKINSSRARNHYYRFDGFSSWKAIVSLWCGGKNAEGLDKHE